MNKHKLSSVKAVLKIYGKMQNLFKEIVKLNILDSF